jgi:hypothetical protein
MKLEEINSKLQLLDFPYYKAKVTNNFCNGVYIVLSLDDPKKWAFGYIENSRYLKAFIFPNGSRNETEKDSYSLSITSNNTKIKMLQANNKTGEKILEHTLKQLEKLK